MTNVEALKALYKALGGDESDVAEINTIADMIAEIAVVAATATAPELPAVTAAENGKVLKVANGKWAVGTDEIQA
jgi:hypothetical protein